MFAVCLHWCDSLALTIEFIFLFSGTNLSTHLKIKRKKSESINNSSSGGTPKRKYTNTHEASYYGNKHATVDPLVVRWFSISTKCICCVFGWIASSVEITAAALWLFNFSIQIFNNYLWIRKAFLLPAFTLRAVYYHNIPLAFIKYQLYACPFCELKIKVSIVDNITVVVYIRTHRILTDWPDQLT